MFSFFSSNPWREANPGRAIVRCEDDYERAVQQVAELGNPAAGSPEELELIGLLEAIEKWEARHDDDDDWS